MTSWHATDGAKTTRLRYASGLELLMDHTAVAAYLLRDGRVEAAFGADRSIPRRERHYRALYHWCLTEGQPRCPPESACTCTNSCSASDTGQNRQLQPDFPERTGATLAPARSSSMIA